jgi:hypothetical protein
MVRAPGPRPGYMAGGGAPPNDDRQRDVPAPERAARLRAPDPSRPAVWVTAGTTEQWFTPVKFVYNVWSDSVDPNDEAMYVTTKELDVGDFYPGVYLPLCSLFSGFHHLAAWAWSAYYDQIGTGFSALRWLDYSFSAPVMLAVNEVLWLAHPDISLLVGVAFLQLLICLVGAGVEQAWVLDGNHLGLLFYGAVFPFIWIWLRYAASISLANDEGASVPVFVWFFLLFLAITFWLFPIVFGAKVLLGRSSDTDRNYRYEARFLLLSALAKIPLLSFFAFGTSQRAGRVVVEGGGASAPTDDDSYIGMGVAGAVTAVVVVGFFVAARPYQWEILWPWRASELIKERVGKLSGVAPGF